MQFAITLPAFSPLPLYKQISNALRDAILSGRLQHGEKLPSTRELSDSLKISRLTVSRGLEDLASQGYVQTILGSGSYVSASLVQQFTPPGQEESDLSVEPMAPPVLSAFGERMTRLMELERETGEKQSSDFDINPALDQLPVRRWREMLTKACRIESDEIVAAASDTFGYLPLRKAIAGYLSRARSINCDASQIVVFPSAGGSTDFILRLLTEAGETVAVENPGLPAIRMNAIASGLRLHQVRVDESGVAVQDLSSCNEQVRLLYTTPSRNPASGAATSLKRRHEILDWAKSNAAIVVENDFDCEYRYGERLLPSIASLDNSQSVIYCSAFFKVLYPLVRFSFIMLPKRLVAVAMKAKTLLEQDFPLIEQKALALLIDEGHFERHIRRSQAVYARRRAAAILGLTRHFKERVAIAPQSAGLHLSIRFAFEMKPAEIEASASAAGVILHSTRRYYMNGARENEYTLEFTRQDEAQVASSLAKFAELLDLNRQSSEIVPINAAAEPVYGPFGA